MYYFLKRNPSRLLTLLLAICMVITMLAGCSRKEENTDPEAGTDNNSVPPGLVEVKPTEEVTEPTETEPLYDNIAYVSFDVDEDGLEVKSAPSSTAKTLGHLDAGTEVEIIKTEPYLGIDWALIREGWVRLEYLDTKNGSNEPDDTDPEETKPQETAPQNTTSIKGTVTSNTGLNIRKEPDGTIIGNYKYGTSITILETRNGWGRTDKGWVSMTYVKTTNGNTTNNQQTNTNTTTDGTAYFITATQLNIRDEASANGKQVGTYTMGDRVVVLETKNGWGRTDKGWISMQYAYKTGATGANTAKGLVIGNGLNVRSGPGTGYDSVGTVNFGKRVDILEQITIGNTTWGCISNGWISLGYVYIDGTNGDGAGTGTVEGDGVNIRSGPGTGFNVVGSLNTGDTVEILAQFEINGTYWGCINNGWVCMDYVGVG